VLIDENDMIGYLENMVHHQDEPLADWACVPLYFVSKLANDNGVTVVQVGEGADEKFWLRAPNTATYPSREFA
jgi:asparagine synthase (glutamine-hydrolysing)